MSQPLTAEPPAAAPEPPELYEPKIDRRTALAWVGVVGAAIAGVGVVVWGPEHTGAVTRGYGTDPKLSPPAKAPWSRIMTAEQLAAAAILADLILPASGSFPAASALGVPDFLDEWVSAPYPDQMADRPLILNGLNDLSWTAQRRFGVSFLAATPAQRTAILNDVRGTAARTRKGFFRRFRWLVVGAYYTTPVGFKDIGYIGNVARARDPGPSDEVKARLEAEFKKLGL